MEAALVLQGSPYSSLTDEHSYWQDGKTAGQDARSSDAGARGPQEDSAARSALCGSRPGGQASSLLFLPDNALPAVLLLHPQHGGEASLASARPGDHAVLIQHGTAVNGTCYASDPHRFTWTAHIIFKAVSRYILGNTFIRKDACQMMNQTALVKWNCVTSTRAF